ncbi:hypothetical protein [Maribacter sp. 2308TA10-17]|uniref:hypothetical protein n=1 Tax=Maribacter sp. 2308TA10-17 TaxID=3386276 RepID=UPI0039BD4F60
MKYAILIVIFMISSCKGQKNMTDNNAKSQIKSDSPMVLILQDQSAEFDVEETLIIRDQKRLKSFYSKINKTRKPGLPLPDVDFTKEIIIAYCSGEQSGDGLAKLTIYDETKTEVFIDSKFEVRTKAPVMIKTNPFCIYKMRITDKEVRFTNKPIK